MKHYHTALALGATLVAQPSLADIVCYKTTDVEITCDATNTYAKDSLNTIYLTGLRNILDYTAPKGWESKKTLEEDMTTTLTFTAQEPKYALPAKTTLPIAIQFNESIKDLELVERVAFVESPSEGLIPTKYLAPNTWSDTTKQKPNKQKINLNKAIYVHDDLFGDEFDDPFSFTSLGYTQLQPALDTNEHPEYIVPEQPINDSTVPIPPAVWLFGSGLVGLLTISRRK